eukprot:5560585-Pyramimonas_sp.AAC.1
MALLSGLRPITPGPPGRTSRTAGETRGRRTALVLIRRYSLSHPGIGPAVVLIRRYSLSHPVTGAAVVLIR